MSKASAEKLSEAGFKYIGKTYQEMDCQEFFEKCLEDVGIAEDLKGSNAWYRKIRNEGWVGSPEECKARFGSVPRGAILFIHAFDGGEEKRGYHDGLGNASHIGIKTGTGEGAIHSSESRGGVFESKFKDKTIPGGWNVVGLWIRMTYGEAIDRILDGGVEPEPSPEPSPEPTPEPERRKAVVWSEDGKPVNTRKGPDESYGQSKAGRIAVGTVVEIVKSTVNSQGEEWYYIGYDDPRGARWYCWIKGDFLRILDDGADGSAGAGQDSSAGAGHDSAEAGSGAGSGATEAEEPTNFGGGDGETVTLTLSRAEAETVLDVLAAITGRGYPALISLCDKIARQTGRG